MAEEAKEKTEPAVAPPGHVRNPKNVPTGDEQMALKQKKLRAARAGKSGDGK